MTTASFPPLEFESDYLQQNKDVRAAVQNGQFSSGWVHYLLHGCGEHRPGVPTGVRTLYDTSATKLPEPPAKLRQRVHGAKELSSFESVGAAVAFDLYRAMTSEKQWDDGSRILDFGCGCARVLRYLHRFLPGCTFFGSDIDHEAIRWCQRHLSSVAQFVVNGFEPPLPFADESFDCIYAVSVFTHLPEMMQLNWLKELERVTRPGGYVLASTHGMHLVPPAHVEKSHGQEFFYLNVGTTKGLPDFYQASFHTHDYIRRRWSDFFEIRSIKTAGIGNHQDLVVCRKRAA